MLVLTSSGFMVQTNGPKHSEEKVINTALHSGIVINSLDAKGLWASSPGGDSSEARPRLPQSANNQMAYQDRLFEMQKQVNQDPLAAMAESTGGRFFHNSNDLGGGLREMAALPDVSYVLGFDPADIKLSGSFHTIKVRLVNQRDVVVEARRGYFAPAPGKSAETISPSATRSENLDRAVRSSDSPSEISASVSAETSEPDSGSQALKVAIHVDIRDLPFQRRADRSVERLIFVTALFDQQNHFLTGVQGVMDLNLKDATLAHLSSQGIDARISLHAPPGSYHLRQVVQEEVSGRLAALNTQVQIH
jgi:hypothetical protein